MIAFNVNLNNLPEELREVAAGFKSLPRDKNVNPLSVWIQSYQLREREAQRPTVNQLGSYRGSTWHQMEKSYQRKTDGVNVYPWGGVKRVGVGRVTRARSTVNAMGETVYTSKRKGRKLGEYASVVPGQTFTKGPVKGKLKADGSRYKASDKQLGRSSGGHLFGEWLSPRNIIISASGLVATLAHPFAWSERVAERRNFVWSSRIESDEVPQFVHHVGAYIDKLLGKVKP